MTSENNRQIENSAPSICNITLPGGISLRYEVSGEGNPLILMHGWGCSLETVRSIAKTASSNHKVYNIDFPGFGESPEPDRIWGVEDYTKVIEEFARQLKIKTPVLIGHSFGGRVSILFASRNKVEKVVLVDAAGIKPQRPLKYYLKVYSFKAAKKILKLIFPKEVADKKIAALRNKKGSADYNNSSPMMKTILSKVVNEDLKRYMPLISAPTLLIWGEKDTATPLKDAEKMNKLIKDSGLVAFKNAGHYSFLDEPYRFSQVLRSFLNS